MPILVMSCLPPTSLLARDLLALARYGAGRPAGPASAGAEGTAAIIARDQPDAQQKAVQWEPAALRAGRSDQAAAAISRVVYLPAVRRSRPRASGGNAVDAIGHRRGAMTDKLTGKVALVTGGSRGIGSAIARKNLIHQPSEGRAG
jgi:hypothetical protein